MLRDLIGNENPRRTSFSIGQIEISALGVALANNALFALLNCKRLRTDNLWILRGMQEKIRLSQVLTLFHSRIQEQDFHFGMIYANHFESIWHTFREKFAPANTENIDNYKTLRLSASCHSYYEWQTAGSRSSDAEILAAGAMTIIPMYDKWLSLWNDYDSLFGSRAVSIGRQSDRNGSEAQPESRDEQGIIHPRQ